MRREQFNVDDAKEKLPVEDQELALAQAEF
jgi:hypothetical protein